MTTKTMIRIITLSMGLLAAVPVMSFAQQRANAAVPSGSSRVDSRWTPYLGCWRLYQENLRSASVPVSDTMTVCVAPSTDSAGVTLTTYVGGRSVLAQTIIADGQSHPVSEADCQGEQRNEWSADGGRLFTHADVTCAGRPKRTISGVTLMSKGATWLDVQATDVDDDSQVRIRRYQRAIERPAGVPELSADLTGRAMADAQSAAAGTMTLEDVIEASKKLSPAALEATLDETNARFKLNSRALKQLADGGVAPTVIDLMVAQSFPSEFHVDRRPTVAPSYPSVSMGSTTLLNGGMYGGAAASMAYPYYDPYYSYYSYYSPFAYPYWGSGYYINNYYYGRPAYYRGGPLYLGVPGDIITGGGIGGGGSVVVNPGDAGGQVINGRGYTRVSPGSASSPSSSGAGDSDPAQHSGSSPRGIRSSSPADSGSVTSSGGYSSGSSSSSPSSSGGGASPGGDSGGRTAQPR
jgi:hypothetical protein